MRLGDVAVILTDNRAVIVIMAVVQGTCGQLDHK